MPVQPQPVTPVEIVQAFGDRLKGNADALFELGHALAVLEAVTEAMAFAREHCCSGFSIRHPSEDGETARRSLELVLEWPEGTYSKDDVFEPGDAWPALAGTPRYPEDAPEACALRDSDSWDNRVALRRSYCEATGLADGLRDWHDGWSKMSMVNACKLAFGSRDGAMLAQRFDCSMPDGEVETLAMPRELQAAFQAARIGSGGGRRRSRSRS